jgi:YidC/Oxa1 family membrane protein insertase
MLAKTPDQIAKLAKLVPSITGYSKEIGIINYFSEHKDKLAGIGNLLKPDELINFKFLGINLGWVPKFNTSDLFGPQAGTYLPLLIIPVFAVVTTFLSAKLTMASTKATTNVSGTASSMQNSMLYVGPVMTLIFSFTLPAGVGLYWGVGYVIQIFQQLYINKNILKTKEVAKK